jgi:hypothetical protein
VFGAEAGQPWVKWQVDNYRRFDIRDSEWGVPLMSVAPRDGLTLVPTATFFPFLWDAKAEEQTVKPETLIVHHWDGDWRACA